MTFETVLYAALAPLVPGERVHPDSIPESAGNSLPWIVYQQVGGTSTNFIDASPPGARNARMQIASWHRSRAEAMALARDVADTLRAHPTLQAHSLGEPTAVYEPDTRRYGARQDFSLWQQT